MVHSGTLEFSSLVRPLWNPRDIGVDRSVNIAAGARLCEQRIVSLYLCPISHETHKKNRKKS